MSDQHGNQGENATRRTIHEMVREAQRANQKKLLREGIVIILGVHIYYSVIGAIVAIVCAAVLRRLVGLPLAAAVSLMVPSLYGPYTGTTIILMHQGCFWAAFLFWVASVGVSVRREIFAEDGVHYHWFRDVTSPQPSGVFWRWDMARTRWEADDGPSVCTYRVVLQADGSFGVVRVEAM